ncbi:MAG: MgtC/SapB family protein [Candidatus Coprovivens sp.]
MIEILSEFMDMFWFQATLKILLAALLTGIIGLERSSLNKPAGFGTHAIIGTTSALVVLLSEYMSIYNNVDMSRIPAQLLSGIGFIGAGTILRNGLNVKGVTTAAGILAVTVIGMAVGSGFYYGAILVTIVVYLTLAYSHKISDKFERFTSLDLKITISNNSQETLNEIQKILNNKKVSIKGIKKTGPDGLNGEEIIEIVGDFDSRNTKISNLISTLIAMENVTEVMDLEE